MSRLIFLKLPTWKFFFGCCLKKSSWKVEDKKNTHTHGSTVEHYDGICKYNIGFCSSGNRMVGPLNVRDTIKPLPRDLEEFVSNSGGHGFIIVSFGSQVASLPSREKVDMLATAFGKLKQLVVWRLKGILCLVRSLWLNKGHLR